MSGLTITIPKKDSYQSSWYNNIIAAIFYSQYSREILKKDIISRELNEIYNFSQPIEDILDNYIRIASSTNPLNIDSKTYQLDYFNYEEDINDLKISKTFYNYLEKHNKQLIAFILPKFLEFIKSSCISIEIYKDKHYIGLYDLVEYKEYEKNEKTLFGFNQKKTIEGKFELKKITKRKIIEKYKTVSDYIIVNKWTDKNRPSIIEDISKEDDDDDIDGIDNIYRLSSIYKRKDDLNITDKIQDRIIFHDYYYKLDSFIITNNDDKPNSKLITSLTYNDKKYIHIDHKDCVELNELKSLNDEFKIHSLFPCDLFKGKIEQNEVKNVSTFNLTTGCNYTLIYVKYKKITDLEREARELDARKKAEQKRDEEKRKAEQKAKQDEEKEKREKFTKLDKLEGDIKDRDKKIKDLQDIYGENYKQDIEEIEKIITFSVNKDNYNNLKTLLREYITILKTNQTEFKRYSFDEWIKKIYEIKEEINSNIQRYQTIEAKTGNKTVPEKLFINFYENIIIYLNRYIFFIVNLLSRQNTISLIKDEIKDLPDNNKISEILDAISKLPNTDVFRQLNDLLTPTDAKIDQILDAISKLPNDAKLKKIETLLTPTDAKLKEILDAISKIPNNDKTKEILDAISKIPNNDNKILIQDLNIKITAMQQELLQKIQEQKSSRKSRDNITIKDEIDDLKAQLQLMRNIQKELLDTARIDNTKIVQELNLKLDAMQQELLSKIKRHSSKSSDNISLKAEITSLNQQLQLLDDIQKKISETGVIDNSKILSGINDLMRSFTEQNANDIINNKELLSLLQEIKSKLDDRTKSSKSKENDLLKLENSELKKQIEILKDIQSKCKRQQKDYERCNKHNMLPYKYIKFKEDELFEAIKEKFKSSSKKPNDKIIIEFIFQYFEKNNKVMNLYIIEKYMGDIYDVMKIFNKKYSIENVDIKQFYRLLASISIYAKFNEKIKKIFIK
jgi:hypothetical protein